MLTIAAPVAAQVADPLEVELDEHGRGCAVTTDIGRVKLGTMCTIMWEYDEYGESLTDFWSSKICHLNAYTRPPRLQMTKQTALTQLSSSAPQHVDEC